MRNDKIKNDLNNIPQDFDHEKLWSGIELPQNKRKNRNAFWFLFFGFSLVVIFAIVKMSDAFVKEHKSLGQQTANEVKFNPDHETGNPSLALKPTPSTINAQNESGIHTVDEFVEISHQDIVTKDTKSKYNNSTKFAQLDRMNSRTTNIQNSFSSLTKNTVDSVKTEGNPIELVRFQSHRDQEETKIALITGGRSNIQQENTTYTDQELPMTKALKPFPLIPFRGLRRKDMPPAISKAPTTIAEKEYAKVQFGISLNMFLSRSLHDFGENEDFPARDQNEKALETKSISFLGHLRVGKFEFYSGFSYVNHNTHLTKTLNEYATINSLNGPAQKIQSTAYSLYNSYNYLDLNIGVGYTFPMNKDWTLIPSLQLGYTLSHDVDGEVFNQKDELISLALIEGYIRYSKWQGQANLKLVRKFSKNWEVGVLLFINTNKSLSIIDLPVHRVSSHGIGVSMQRHF